MDVNKQKMPNMHLIVDNAIYVVLIVFCIVLLKLIPEQISNSNAQGWMGPRTYPYIMAVGMLLMAVIAFVQNILKNLQGEFSGPAQNMLIPRVVIVFCMALLWVVLLDKIGFLLDGFFLILVTMICMGNRNRAMLIILPLAITGILCFSFTVLLKMHFPILPGGIL